MKTTIIQWSATVSPLKFAVPLHRLQLRKQVACLTYSYHEFRDNASTCQKVSNPLVFIPTILDMLQVVYEEVNADPVFIFTHRLAWAYREQIDD